MNVVITLFTTFIYNLPWIAIGLLAALALRRHKTSKALMLQAAGAALTVLLAFGRWLVIDVIMFGLDVRPTLINGTHYIFAFLMFLALAAFALGYCIDHFSKRKVVDVQGFPVT